MRGLVASSLVALALAVCVLGLGWTLQAEALPAPENIDRVAADAAGWLLRYRLVASSFQLDGRRETGLCLHGWFRRRGGRVRGTLLELGSGVRIFTDGGPLQIAPSGQPEAGPLPGLQLELAGCSALVGSDVATAAQQARRLRVSRAYAAGAPALALRLAADHGGLLTLYLRPRTHLPVAVAASAGSHHGRGSIRLTRATPKLLERLSDLWPLRRPGPG